MEGLLKLLREIGVQSAQLRRRLEEYNLMATSGTGTVFRRSKALAEISGLIAGFPDSEVRRLLTEWSQQEVEAVERDKEECRFSLGRMIVASLAEIGMEVRGQLPLLRVGLFTLKADIAAGKGTIFWGPEVEVLKKGVNLAPAELAAVLRQLNEELRAHATADTGELLARLHTAYRRCCLLSGSGDGTRVLLADILAEMAMLVQPQRFRNDPVKANFVEYPRVRFSYELYLLRQTGTVRHGAATLRLHVANFDATTEKSKALWVPDNETGDGTHYSYLSFVTTSSPGEGVDTAARNGNRWR